MKRGSRKHYPEPVQDSSTRRRRLTGRFQATRGSSTAKTEGKFDVITNDSYRSGGWFKLVGTNSYFSELLGSFRVARTRLSFKLESFDRRIERNARFVSSRRGNKPKIIIRSLNATIVVNLNRSSKRFLFLQGFSTAIIRLLGIPVVLLHPFPVSKFPSFPLRETLVGVLIRERIKRIENIFRANSFRHVSPTSCSFKFT